MLTLRYSAKYARRKRTLCVEFVTEAIVQPIMKDHLCQLQVSTKSTLSDVDANHFSIVRLYKNLSMIHFPAFCEGEYFLEDLLTIS